MLKRSIFTYQCHHNSVNPHSTYFGLELTIDNGILQTFLRENIIIPLIYLHCIIEASVNASDNSEMHKELLKLEYTGAKDGCIIPIPPPIFHLEAHFSFSYCLLLFYLPLTRTKLFIAYYAVYNVYKIQMNLSKCCLTAWETKLNIIPWKYQLDLPATFHLMFLVLPPQTFLGNVLMAARHSEAYGDQLSSV